MNLILISVVCAWLFTQSAKAAIAKKKRHFFECGGMPSSHSAFVSALSTAVGLIEGFDSTIFLITLAFSIIIVHDAVQIRKQHTMRQVAVGIAIGVAVTLLVKHFFF